jgi:carboxyl-terminal processing protease
LIQRPFDKGLAAYYEEAMDEEDPNLLADSTATKPVFRTRAGRKVYGGGGITPDVRIRSGRLTQYTSRLRTQQVFFDFANHAATAGALRKQVEALGQQTFLKSWEPDEALLREFVQSVGDKVPFHEEQWRQDLPWIRGYLKREIARVVFDRDVSQRVDLEIDPVVAEALLLFPEAERIQQLATKSPK